MSTHTGYEELYRETIPSVVSVYVTTGRSRRPGSSGAGSGFVFDVEEGGTSNHRTSSKSESNGHTGYVVTNQHVVRTAEEIELRFSKGDWRTGNVAGTDAYTDLAVIYVEDLPEYATSLPIATTNPIPGESVAALGNPMGLDGTITTGIVSGTNRSMRTGNSFSIPDVVQTDAPINPGNSGGPLVTLDGEVVGVNRARSGDNLGFAISPEIVTRVVPSLIADGTYHHSYLDVRTIDVSPAVAEANSLEEPRGVLVVDVSLGPSSAALKGSRGTRRVRNREVPVGGDVIVGVNDQEIRSHEELMRYLITETQPDEAVSVDIIRDGRKMTEQVTLGKRPAAKPRIQSHRRRGAAPGR